MRSGLTGRLLGDSPRPGRTAGSDALHLPSTRSKQYAPQVAPRAENQTHLRAVSPEESDTEESECRDSQKGYEAFGASDIEIALAEFDDDIE